VTVFFRVARDIVTGSNIAPSLRVDQS